MRKAKYICASHCLSDLPLGCSHCGADSEQVRRQMNEDASNIPLEPRSIREINEEMAQVQRESRVNAKQVYKTALLNGNKSATYDLVTGEIITSDGSRI